MMKIDQYFYVIFPVCDENRKYYASCWEGIEPTYLVYRASVLTITPPRLADVTTFPRPTCLFGSLPERSVQTTHTTLVPLVTIVSLLMLTITYSQ